jgi:Lon protease-like protein
MPVIPMFPLGTVLLPAMPFALNVFEPRYLKMMGDLLETDAPEFGIVLIERGHEVGGGEQRLVTGTIADIAEIEAPEGHLVVTGHGTRRFDVVQWLDDDPYPQAEVEFRDEDDEPEGLSDRLVTLEIQVRDALQKAHDYQLGIWPVDVPLSDDPVAKLWQLAGISPLSTLDHYTLLQSATLDDLVEHTTRLVDDAASGLTPGS